MTYGWMIYMETLSDPHIIKRGLLVLYCICAFEPDSVRGPGDNLSMKWNHMG